MDTPTILIVDDESGQRETIRSYVEPRMRCSIVEAASGADAVSYIKANRCDLIILDIKMPHSGGLEVLDVAKNKEISVIIYSAWDSEQVFNECEARGIVDYVTKGGSIRVLGDKAIKELKRKGMYAPRP